MQAAATAFASRLDQVLRSVQGSAQDLLRTAMDLPLRHTVYGCLAMGALYGACMGVYALTMQGVDGLPQLLASTVKVPLVFLLTLGITFPSLYVFSTLAGSPLRIAETARLLLLTIAVHLTVLASFGTIEVFFVLCTDSYGFVKLMNVVFFGFSGVLSLRFLLLALTAALPTRPEPETAPRPGQAQTPDEADDTREGEGAPAPPPSVRAAPPRRDRPDHGWARRVFLLWILVYGVVGAQTAWLLRPFLGRPDRPFEWFRGRESNFFADVVETLGDLFS